MMIINLDSVSKSIRGNLVIDNVSLRLKSENIYGLCGYNGCGKTMLMRLISGLIFPTKGKIMIDGKQLGKDMDFPPDLGLLIENPAFIGKYSGFDNLKMLALIRGKVDDDQIKTTLERVGLGDSGKKPYRKYSLGMRQRLGIAAAIMEKPSLIILDEPTNALDFDGVILTKQIIREEKSRGALIIMTCHDKSVLEDLCDTVYRIENGRIIDTEVEKK